MHIYDVHCNYRKLLCVKNIVYIVIVCVRSAVDVHVHVHVTVGRN